jgi:hypothetical protein
MSVRTRSFIVIVLALTLSSAGLRAETVDGTAARPSLNRIARALRTTPDTPRLVVSLPPAALARAQQGQGTTGSFGGGRKKMVPLLALIGAGGGALAGTVAECTSVTIDSAGTSCDNRGATVGAYAVGGALAGALVGLIFGGR